MWTTDRQTDTASVEYWAVSSLQYCVNAWVCALLFLCVYVCVSSPCYSALHINVSSVTEPSLAARLVHMKILGFTGVYSRRCGLPNAVLQPAREAELRRSVLKMISCRPRRPSWLTLLSQDRTRGWNGRAGECVLVQDFLLLLLVTPLWHKWVCFVCLCVGERERENELV